MKMCYVRVKICGICTLEEAKAAVEAGAHALGFVFAASKRRVTPEQAAKIIRGLPPFISKTGVFVNEKSSVVMEIAEYCGLDTLQFHGEEPVSYCVKFASSRYKIIKAFPFSPSLEFETCMAYPVNGILLDTKYENRRGGGGMTFNWQQAKQFRNSRKPLILAGGLNADNVLSALSKLHPFGVDVSSGVEKNGTKDREKIFAFMEKIKCWNDRLFKIDALGRSESFSSRQ